MLERLKSGTIYNLDKAQFEKKLEEEEVVEEVQYNVEEEEEYEDDSE